MEGCPLTYHEVLNPIIGSICGDIVGTHGKEADCTSFSSMIESGLYTGITVMSQAVAETARSIAFGYNKTNPEFNESYYYDSLKSQFKCSLQEYCRRFPVYGFSNAFRNWLVAKNPEPYYSSGNECAVRVSSIPCFSLSLEHCEKVARVSAEVTNRHPDGIVGAQAVAGAIYLAQRGASKSRVKEYIDRYYSEYVAEYLENIGLTSFTLNEIRPYYNHDYIKTRSCKGTVPFAVEAFLEGNSIEECIRLAVSIGGNRNALGAITGAIAVAYYGCKYDDLDKVISHIPIPLADAFFYCSHSLSDLYEDLEDKTRPRKYSRLLRLNLE